MSQINIKEIEDKLSKRFNFSDNSDEDTYNEKLVELNNRYPYGDIDGFHSPYYQEKKKLYDDKLKTIRKNLNDDEGFTELYEKLDALNAYKTQKQTELDKAKTPTISGRVSSFFSSNAKYDNAAKITTLEAEIRDLSSIIDKLRELKRIYDMDMDMDITNNETGGGKRKSRRNKKSKKSKKSKKNHRKIESSSNFIEKNVKKIFNIG